ncbi:MAG TPA: amino acid adenylation domain-containing protein, partial [Jatrophihabitans sp.]|nr:amino acid adenylation domain-containing protein [Jatrophihabitans sp.]
YLPLDPAYPAGRLAAMLSDAAPVLVLTHPPAQSTLPSDLKLIDLVDDATAWAGQPVSDPVVADLTPDRLAYVIYTSGSTGTSNGVQVEHRQLAGIAAGWQQLLDLRPGLTHLQLASLSFDVCTADVIRSLGFGGRLVLCPRELLADSAGLFAFIQQHQVNFADFVPAVLLPLLSYLESAGGDLAGFETLICGSEAWTPAAADRLRALCGPSVRIVNAYGLTEAAVDSTHYPLPIERPTDWDGLGYLPIGQPLPGVRAYLLDRLAEPVPDGVAGELYLGGVGVARGYLNRPELTAQRFLDSPFVPGDRLYRTGDLARRLPSGDLEFLGRRDQQVKLRGLRVELAEIEAVLAGCPGVREAVVTADGQRLLAYYLADPDRCPAIEELRDQLADRLPAHMLPAGYQWLDSWPLTPNGKLDRAELPAIDAESGYQPPADPLEERLAGLWAELLGVEQVGRQDHFFALGGHSLLAMRLVALIRQRLGREVSPAALFAAPRLADFAELLRTVRADELLPPIRPVDRSGPLEPSFAQQRLWFLAQLEGAGEAYHMPQAWQLDGPLDRVALGRALDALMARHEALRTRFVGTSSATQLIDPPEMGFPLQVEDLTDQPEALARIQQDEASVPFDLSAGPLARGRLVVLAPQRHVLLLTLHHIVSDGWSVGVLIRELAALYGAFLAGSDDPLPPLPVQYADYAAWQRAWFADRILEQQAEYWQRALADAPALLTLPTDRPRPAEPDYRGGQLRVEFDAELTAGLRALSAKQGCTVYMTVLAAWALVLSRLSGQDDVVIGTPTANRRRHELEGLIGFFVNTLAIRLDLSGAPTGAELLGRSRKAI